MQYQWTDEPTPVAPGETTAANPAADEFEVGDIADALSSIDVPTTVGWRRVKLLLDSTSRWRRLAHPSNAEKREEPSQLDAADRG